MSAYTEPTIPAPRASRLHRFREPVVTALGQGRVRWAYEAVMIALAVTVAVLLAFPDEGWVRTANVVIWAIFVVDYVVRLGLSTDRRRFVRRNVPDLIAILPLDFFRLARLARLVRLLRAGTVLWRVSADFRGVLATNGLSWILAVTTGTILAGALAIWALEPAMGSFLDALWWSIVTATTVGYGDISPASELGRLVAVVLMLVGIGTIGMITGSIATYFIRNETSNPQVEWIRDQLDRWDDMDTNERQRVAAMLSSLCDLPTGESRPHSV